MRGIRGLGVTVWRHLLACALVTAAISLPNSASGEESPAISPGRVTALNAVIEQSLTAKIFDDRALGATYKSIAAAAELKNRGQLDKIEALVVPWLQERAKGVEQLSRCLKQECLPSDVGREVRQIALLLNILNQLESQPVMDFARDHGATVKGLLGQFVVTDGELRMPMLLKLQVLADLLEYADNTSDSGLSHLVTEQTIKLLPSIAGSVRGRGFGEKSFASEIFNSQIGALRIYLLFYHSTAERSWIGRAQQIGRILSTELLEPSNGTLRAKPELLEDALTLSPLLVILHHYTGNADFLNAAQGIIRQAAEQIQPLSPGMAADALRAARRLSGPPLHITVVGRKVDPDAILLFGAARKIKNPYKRLEWWDESEGKMLNPDVRFPSLRRSAAFVCAEKRCSMPVFDPKDIRRVIDEFQGGPQSVSVPAGSAQSVGSGN